MMGIRKLFLIYLFLAPFFLMAQNDTLKVTANSYPANYSNLKAGKLTFAKFKKPSLQKHVDTATIVNLTMYKQNGELPGYLWGKFRGADSSFYFIETNQIYYNCYFNDIIYQKLAPDKYIAAINKNDYLEVAFQSKHTKIHTASEAFLWVSSVVMIFSPLVCIDYKKGKFLESRYFGINRIAAPVFAVNLPLYLLTEFKTIRVSKTYNPVYNNLYYPVD